MCCPCVLQGKRYGTGDIDEQLMDKLGEILGGNMKEDFIVVHMQVGSTCSTVQYISSSSQGAAQVAWEAGWGWQRHWWTMPGPGHGPTSCLHCSTIACALAGGLHLLQEARAWGLAHLEVGRALRLVLDVT